MLKYLVPVKSPDTWGFRMRLFCLQLEASCLQWSFILTVDNFSFFTYNWNFFAYSFSVFTYSWSFFAYSGKVRLIRALRDCKQRSLTVSKKAPTVSKKASPGHNYLTSAGGALNTGGICAMQSLPISDPHPPPRRIY